jgi:hypothetical protein
MNFIFPVRLSYWSFHAEKFSTPSLVPHSHIPRNRKAKSSLSFLASAITRPYHVPWLSATWRANFPPLRQAACPLRVRSLTCPIKFSLPASFLFLFNFPFPFILHCLFPLFEFLLQHSPRWDTSSMRADSKYQTSPSQGNQFSWMKHKWPMLMQVSAVSVVWILQTFRRQFLTHHLGLTWHRS